MSEEIGEGRSDFRGIIARGEVFIRGRQIGNCRGFRVDQHGDEVETFWSITLDVDDFRPENQRFFYEVCRGGCLATVTFQGAAVADHSIDLHAQNVLFISAGLIGINEGADWAGMRFVGRCARHHMDIRFPPVPMNTAQAEMAI